MAGEPCGRALTQTVGRLWCEGIKIDWVKYYETEDRRRVPLPTYPFERQRYWVTQSGLPNAATSSDPLALKDSREKWLYATNWKRTNPLPRPEFGNNSFAGGWLVFSEADGIGVELASDFASLARRYMKRGETKCSIRTERALSRCNAGNPEDYQRLLQSLGEICRSESFTHGISATILKPLELQDLTV